MYLELHNYEEMDQKTLYFKLDSAFNIDAIKYLNKKIRGIYAIFNDENCIYVGQSKNIASRLATHMRGKYKNATSIHTWDILEIGFNDFDSRSKDSQINILNNCEKYLMSKLKPIDNIDIDMDFILDEDNAPDLSYLGFNIRINSNEYYISISDSYSYAVEGAICTIDYMHYEKVIDDDKHKIISKAIREYDTKIPDSLGDIVWV